MKEYKIFVSKKSDPVEYANSVESLKKWAEGLKLYDKIDNEFVTIFFFKEKI